MINTNENVISINEAIRRKLNLLNSGISNLKKHSKRLRAINENCLIFPQKINTHQHLINSLGRRIPVPNISEELLKTDKDILLIEKLKKSYERHSIHLPSLKIIESRSTYYYNEFEKRSKIVLVLIKLVQCKIELTITLIRITNYTIEIHYSEINKIISESDENIISVYPGYHNETSKIDEESSNLDLQIYLRLEFLEKLITQKIDILNKDSKRDIFNDPDLRSIPIDFANQKTQCTTFLFVAANPSDETRLKSLIEYEKIKDLLELQKIYVYLPVFAATTDRLIKALKKNPNIVHFAGHGNKDGIKLLNRDNDTGTLASNQTLIELFDPFKEHIRLVVLNSCFSKSQAKDISQLGIYVIGMSDELNEDKEIAIIFSSTLYNVLAENLNIEKAFKSATALYHSEFDGESNKPELWKDGVQIL
jgi:hypothetical protein